MSSELLNKLLEDIESDKAWRDKDLNFFENLLSNETEENNQKILSKALILLLYSYFEGHVKFIFESYVHAINQLNLSCNQVIIPLIASNLDPIFKEFKDAYRSPTHNRIFKQEHPKDFVELGRRVEFLENFETIMTTPVNLKVNNIVDTESNLSKKVLLKILYRVGFDSSTFQEQQIGKIEKLLQFRNAIAHGSQQEGWTMAEYTEMKDEITELIKSIRTNVIDHFSNEKFKKAP